MNKSKLLKLMAIFAAFAILLTACGGGSTEAEKPETEEPVEVSQEDAPAEVEVEDAHGKVTVPVNPEVVVSLDSRTFQTLEDWGVELAAVPKDVMPPSSGYVADESVKNIGNHREPNLEIIAEVNPDLVIIGQRFVKYYDEIKALVPNAAVIDLNIDVGKDAENSGENLINGLKDITTTVGKIFDKEAEAEALIAEFEASKDEAAAAYNGTDTIMSVVVSGGEIGFSAPHSGRVWGPLYEVFGWVPALEIDDASSDHKGDDVSVEAIAQSNPDWIMILDRDAATSSAKDSVPAKDVIEGSQALANTKAVTEGHLIYAPAEIYTNESIQIFTKLFNEIADVLPK